MHKIDKIYISIFLRGSFVFFSSRQVLIYLLSRKQKNGKKTNEKSFETFLGGDF
jgi:hypothetical protein